MTPVTFTPNEAIPRKPFHQEFTQNIALRPKNNKSVPIPGRRGIIFAQISARDLTLHPLSYYCLVSNKF